MVTTAQEHRPLRSGVLGPGGVGGMLTVLLSHVGAEVSVVANPLTCEALTRRGISLHSDRRFGTITIETLHCAPTLAEPVDVLFVAVKAINLESALERVPQSLMTTALVVPLLNGIEHVDLLRRRYPEITLAAAGIRVEATKAATGVIEHHSPFITIELAAADDPVRTRQCASLLRHAGVQTTTNASERAVLWSKFGFLAPLALLTTYHQAPAGIVRTRYRDDLMSLSEEVAEVAQKDGAELDPSAALDFFDSVPYEMKSSMQKDAEAGRRTELEAIGGTLLRQAQRQDVPVPVATRYVETLRQLTLA